jgi:hypothetical protein
MLKLKQLLGPVLFALGLALIFAPIFGTSLALAQSSSVAPISDSTVTFGWGDFIGQLGMQLLPWAGLALLTVITGLLPAPVRAIVQKYRTAQVDQLLERALGYAATRLRDQLQGQTLSIDVHSKLVKEATDYAIQQGSKAVLDYAGEISIPDKLSARVLTSPSVQAARGMISPAFPSAAAK